jgi:hypothetical protein
MMMSPFYYTNMHRLIRETGRKGVGERRERVGERRERRPKEKMRKQKN